jgi:hypothetical protein
MNDSYQARILSKIQDVSITLETDSLLTNLITTERDVFGNEQNDASFFYNIFPSSIKQHELSCNSLDENQLNLIAQYIKWSKDHWIQITEDGNVQKSILIYAVLEYFNFSEDILDWKSISPQFVGKIEHLFSKIHGQMCCPDDAPYCEMKAYERCQQSINGRDFGKILQFLHAMENRPSLSIFLRSLIKIAFKISPKAFAELLCKSYQTPDLIKEMLNILDPQKVLIFFADQYEEKEIFPLILFFDFYIDNDRKSKRDGQAFLNADEIDKLVLILGKIIPQLKKLEPLYFFTKNLNLSRDVHYHLILGQYIATHNEYITEYSKIIDFDAAPANGTAFWKSFTEKMNSETPLLELSDLIEQNYFLYAESKNTLRVNQVTGYLNFIYYSIHSHFNTPEKYHDELSVTIKEIQKLISSWDHSKLMSRFHKLFLLITANPAALNYAFAEDEISDVLIFLNDNRLKLVFGENPNLLKECLVKSSQIKEIPVTDNEGKNVKMSINYRE